MAVQALECLHKAIVLQFCMLTVLPATDFIVRQAIHPVLRGVFVGDVYSSGTYYGSDARLKNNIKDFGNAMQIIGALQPKNYDYKKDGVYAGLNLPRGNHYGLIAQDLEKILPNLVKGNQPVFKRQNPETR